MNKKVSKILASLILCTLMTANFFIFNANIASAAKTTKQLFEGSLKTTGQETGYSVEGSKDIWTIIGQTLQIALSFVGVIFLILMLYGGFVWMKARGNETEVNRAKGIIQMALAGLIIIMVAYSITVFVSGQLVNNFVG